MRSEEEVTASLKREFAINLVEQTSLWFFDKWGSSYSPQAIKLIDRGRAIWEAETSLPAAEAAEVLMVVDPDNVSYVNNMHPNSNCFQLPWKLNLNRSGAPFTIASFFDIPHLEMSRYKVIIFCHPFEIDERRREILERFVCHSGRTVFWSYGPGVIHQGKWCEERVREVCGTPFGTPGISMAEFPAWRSGYVFEPQKLTPERVRELLKEAGVWLYASAPRPVSVNERLLGVHTGMAERLTLSLPRRYRVLTELFSGAVFRDTDLVELESFGPDTWLFRLES